MREEITPTVETTCPECSGDGIYKEIVGGNTHLILCHCVEFINKSFVVPPLNQEELQFELDHPPKKEEN